MGENKALVSIIMNCYNSDKYLVEAIESVLNQDYDNWELIFWDNQSTDNSAKIVDSFLDKRIKYFYSEKHTSLGEARNNAASKASGSWIGFLDCDDKWQPFRLSILLNNITKSNANLGFVFTRAIYFRDTFSAHSSVINSNIDVVDILSSNENVYMLVPSIDFQQTNNHVFEKLLEAFYFPWVTVLINKHCFDLVGGFDNDYKSVEDYDILLKIASKYEACFINETTAYYRIHNSNISVEKTEESLFEAIALLRKYLPNKSAKKGIFNNKYSLLRFYHTKEKRKFITYSFSNPNLLLKFIYSNFRQVFKNAYLKLKVYFK